MNEKHIIMNFTFPPSLEDIEVMAKDSLEIIPEELFEFCEELDILIQEVPDDSEINDLELDDPFDLLVLYKSGNEISPGVERTVADEDDVLTLYRRPILDYWCETGEDLGLIIRQLIIEEIARTFDFSDEEIEEMVQRHFQGLL